MDYYTPDRWVVLEFTTTRHTTYKVLAGWSGGYLQGQSWKLNSGITKVEEDGDCYLFHGASGSVYCCRKSGYGWNSYMTDVYRSFEEKINDIDANMTVMPEKTNFLELNI